MSAQSRPLLVLYADISGSTALYEQYGDDLARADCATCIEVMVEVMKRFDGRLVKTIGDEVMCVFHDPAKGAMAATDMQTAVRRANEESRFKTRPQRIKVGFHYGPGIEEEHDIAGEAPITAQQLINMAKADQVLTSRATLEALPPELRAAVRFVDRVPAEAWSGEVEAYEMIWEVSGVTQISESLVERTRPRDVHERLTVTFRGEQHVLDRDHPRLTLGRVEGNDIVVANDLVSRNHALFELERGRFHFTDQSSNGSFLEETGGDVVRLRRERLTLRGSGRVCLGGPPEQNPEALVDFVLEP